MAFDPLGVGQKMVSSGEKLVQTGEKMRAHASQIRPVAERLTNKNAAQSLETIEDAMKSIRDLLQPVASTLGSIADGLRSLTVPSLDVQTQSIDFPGIGRVRFVTGISVSNERPLSTAARQVDSVVENITNVRGGLLTIAKAMNQLQSNMSITISGRPSFYTGTRLKLSQYDLRLIDATRILMRPGDGGSSRLVWV